MYISFTLKNYRCFPDSFPARFDLRNGFTGFVGVNNSGKSSLLKFFYEFRPLFRMLGQPWGSTLTSAFTGSMVYGSYTLFVPDKQEIFCNQNDRPLEIEITFHEFPDSEEIASPPAPEKMLINLMRNGDLRMQLFLSDSKVALDTRSGFGIDGGFVTFGITRLRISPLWQIFRQLADALYIGPFRNALNIGENANYYDIQTGQAFIRKWNEYKNGSLLQKRNDAIRVTKDIRQIFGFQELEINPANENQNLMLVVDGQSYQLLEMGSGLAQFIVVFATALMSERQPSFILIDEPELNLHPQLQLDFLTRLATYASEGVVYATHSIGLARSSADWLYAVQKGANRTQAITQFSAIASLSEFLGELSFSTYQELGFDKLLLVEGPQDTKTVQHFLRIFGKDHEIVILSLGGSSLINGNFANQLPELLRITHNITVLIDSERNNQNEPLSTDRQEFVEICQKANVRVHVLTRRAIEHYLPDRAVKAIKGDKYSALEPYENFEDKNPRWSKSDNWRIAFAMTDQEIEEFKQMDLGKFLNDI